MASFAVLYNFSITIFLKCMQTSQLTSFEDDDLLKVALAMRKNVDIKSRRNYYKTYPDCFLGNEAVKLTYPLYFYLYVDPIATSCPFLFANRCIGC